MYVTTESSAIVGSKINTVKKNINGELIQIAKSQPQLRTIGLRTYEVDLSSVGESLQYSEKCNRWIAAKSK